MVGIRFVGVGERQSEDYFVCLARSLHKRLAREISDEIGRRREKASQ